MNIKPIHNEKDYKEALELASSYFENEPELGTPEGNEFDILLTLIESYESKHFPIEVADPIEAIKFRLEQSGKEFKDLVPMIGKMNRVYEVMNGSRALSLRMIREIHWKLKIPAESLIKDYSIDNKPKKLVAGKYVSRPRVMAKGTQHAIKLSSGRSKVVIEKTA